ncbi:unnamed protein product [Arctia plantaginis]|uniref:snRNA-activating protein complex subunit 1 n=1 Tax=Arctia plantaginis TaxID=874455 RepID=A0A8S1APZ4_ARCPL|nr:unnamed protein product [Arctia plantaginis]
MAAYLCSTIADGFADDCDELIHQCLKETPVTYSAFCKVFRSMQISCVYLNRHSGAEIAELTEELIYIAKYYMVANTNNFESTIVGLFLVYALVKVQPFKDFAYLRLTEEDVPYIERIELVARRERRLDVLYVLGHVLTVNTRFTAAARERGMEASYRKYLENCVTLDIGQRPKGVFLRQNEELDVIKELTDLQLRYDAAKMAANFPDLKYADSKFATELNSSLKNIVAGIIDDDNTQIETEEEKVEESARSIKDRAMKIKVEPMRHLIGVQDRSPNKANKPHMSDIKTKPGKIKSGSPTKQSSANARKQTTTNTRASKRKRLDNYSDTSDEAELSLELSDHDSDNDIDLDNFDKVQPAQDTNATENVAEVEIASENINLGGLPCIITSEDNGQSYEIEIIDRYNKSANKTSERSGIKPEYRNAIDHEQQTRKEKRDLKKTILKSRFKRMGMEPVADFEDT